MMAGSLQYQPPIPCPKPPSLRISISFCFLVRCLMAYSRFMASAFVSNAS